MIRYPIWHIPIPREVFARRRLRSRLGHKIKKYPWHELSVGESFFIPCSGETAQRRVRQALAGQASQMRRYGKTFVPWPVPNGVRVWRLQFGR